jgi:hypothetical protein
MGQGTGLLHLWSVATRQALYPNIDEQIKARLTDSEACRYEREHSRNALQQRLRAVQFAGHDITTIIGQITAAPMNRPGPSPACCTAACSGSRSRSWPGTTSPWRSAHPPAPPPSPASSPAAWTAGSARSANGWPPTPQPWLARRLGVLVP